MKKIFKTTSTLSVQIKEQKHDDHLKNKGEPPTFGKQNRGPEMYVLWQKKVFKLQPVVILRKPTVNLGTKKKHKKQNVF